MELEQINVTRAEWNELNAEQQIALLSRQAQSWAESYFVCAITHNIGVQVYQESVARRDAEIARREAQKTPEKPKRSFWLF